MAATAGVDAALTGAGGSITPPAMSAGAATAGASPNVKRVALMHVPVADIRGNRIREVVFCPERVVKDCVHEVLDDRCSAEVIRSE